MYVPLPVSVLEQLMAIRVHADECTAENGPSACGSRIALVRAIGCRSGGGASIISR